MFNDFAKCILNRRIVIVDDVAFDGHSPFGPYVLTGIFRNKFLATRAALPLQSREREDPTGLPIDY